MTTRIKYPYDLENALRERQETHDLLEMVNYVRMFWGIPTTPENLRKYLSRRKIRYKGYNPSKAHAPSYPVGYERPARDDGMVMVKTEDGWDYKQRVVWKKHYGEIPKNHFIIFLDGDRTNYDISNLACVSSRESSYMANYKLFTNDKDITNTGLSVVKLITTTKNKQGIGPKKGHKKKKEV